jgi:hypothetical protein
MNSKVLVKMENQNDKTGNIYVAVIASCSNCFCPSDHNQRSELKFECLI